MHFCMQSISLWVYRNNTKLSYMKHLLAVAITSMMFVACKKEAPIVDLPALKDKFNGKYAIESCRAEDALDLNMDQIGSVDLLLENVNLAEAKLELRILEFSQHLFTEAWPVEYISLLRGSVFDSTRFDPSYRILYALYGYGTFFDFSKDLKSLQLVPRGAEDDVNTLVGFESVNVEAGERIKVTELRRFFTFNGWKTARIVSVYKRYTKVT